MKKNLFKVIAAVLATVSVACFTACGKKPQESNTAGGTDKITLLLSGWTNTPTSADDPYRKWIADNYGLDVSLNATTDFANSVMIGFSSKIKPNIVAFPSFTSFRQIRDQGVLLDDWTPYLEKMPNFKKILESDSQKFTKQVMTDANGKLNAVWTPATPPTWSLKIREDWANEYRALTDNYDKNGNVATDSASVYIPAGATVTDGGKWMPNSPDDLLYFARYIKVFKNKGLASADYYGFTTAGGKNSLGTLETWMPLMWGRVPVVPYGYYVADGKVLFSTTDGSFEPYLNYLRNICDEELIDPSWFSQLFSDDKRTTYGKIGIQWYPGSISSSTQIDANANRKEDEKIDTTDWWETYPLPVADDAVNEYAGYMAGMGLAGNIITVSKQTSLNKALMEKICKLIDDCYAYHDEATGEYHRGVAYDALRWGVGIEDGVNYKNIPSSTLVYCNTAGDNKKTYRGQYSGAWDWGAWISSSYDGVVQGTDKEITSITLKVAEHNLKTATYKTTPQIGEFLTLDSGKVTDVVADMVSFAYKYATRTTEKTVAGYCAEMNARADFKSLLAEAENQFRTLGLLK